MGSAIGFHINQWRTVRKFQVKAKTPRVLTNIQKHSVPRETCELCDSTLSLLNGQVTRVRCFCSPENLSEQVELQEFCQSGFNTPTYAKKPWPWKKQTLQQSAHESRVRLHRSFQFHFRNRRSEQIFTTLWKILFFGFFSFFSSGRCDLAPRLAEGP